LGQFSAYETVIELAEGFEGDLGAKTPFGGVGRRA
jgi:hypothetical protein